MNDEPSYFGLTNDHTWLSVDAEDQWKYYSESFKEDAKAMLEAVGASELLEALIQAVAWMDGEQTPINALVHARSIIAKARGEKV